MLKSNVSVKVFQVLIVLIQNDLWKFVVLHCGTSYFAVLVLLEDDILFLNEPTIQ